MKVLVVKDSPILIPNDLHKNFTHAGSIIEGDTVVNGNPKNIIGLRRGRKHVYRLFLTDDGLLLNLRNLKKIEMHQTEKNSGADSQVSATKVNITNSKTNASKKYIAAIAGVALGFAVAKYQKKDRKKQIMYAVVAGIAGFGVGFYLDGGASGIKINPSK